MAAGAMLTAIGVPVGLVTIAADPAAPEVYSHVYLIAHAPSGDIAVDASNGLRSNWYAPAAGKAKIWEVPLLRRSSLKGLSDGDGYYDESGAWVDTSTSTPPFIPTYGPATPTTTAPASSPLNSLNLNSMLNQWTQIAGRVIAPTTTVQRGANGQLSIETPAGSPVSSSLMTSTAGSSWLLIAIAAVAGILLFARKSA
jgi:hypothetical protein